MKLALLKKLGFWLGWLFLAMALASLVWSFLLWRYPLPVAEKSTSTNPVASQAIGLNGLEKHWLVGEQKSPQRVETNEPIQVSRLAVKVQGILFSNQAERSVVMLSYRNKDLTLSTGDELETGILLVKIKQDALVFDRNGQLEQVLLDLDKTAQLDQPLEEKLSKPASAKSNELPSQVTEQRVGSRVLEETFGPEFRQSLVQDPLQLMSYISISHSSKEGQLQGFVLQPGSKPELFKHFGLQAGDLLVAVDGDLVSDTSAMMDLHSRLATAEGLDIDLMRGDERLRIRIEME
ncbi:MAG: type II secretion system protein GspC [Pseudomonadaceae bacterium]|nr:type II secretion system protein GspC [Pseudomonadaceae bacterium]